jgi:hypothetical protein
VLTSLLGITTLSDIQVDMRTYFVDIFCYCVCANVENEWRCYSDPAIDLGCTLSVWSLCIII